MKKPWDGRFEKDTDRMVEKFTSSIDFYKKLYEQDILGSDGPRQDAGQDGDNPKTGGSGDHKGASGNKAGNRRGTISLFHRI